ncbi:MAG: murein biosynthesis integral membrane protein MurJ [Porticoccaceae bacterium]
MLRSSSVVGSMTMVSRVLGLIRDVVLARAIGADGMADAFFVAFKIPNFLRRLFAEGAFAQAFVPVLAEYREKGGTEAVRALIDRVAGVLGSVLILLTVLVVAASPLVATLFAPGFLNDPLRFDAASQMIRITFPYLFFISMTGLAAGILNSYGRFAIPAFTPVWLNVSLIAAALWGAAWFHEPAYALAWGVFAAGAVQMLFQIPFLRGIGLMPAPKVDWKYEGVVKILKLMGPAIFGVSVSQINLLLDTVIASFLPTGSVSWLYYSDRLSELPLGVFGIALATVILPSLSRQHARASLDTFGHTLDWGVRMVLLVAVPATLALVILAKPILITLFYDGNRISSRDIFMSSASLIAYASGLSAFMLIKVLAPGFYARQDTRTPVRIGVIAMVSNMVMNLVFVLICHHFWQMGHVGLAAATALAAFLNAGLLWRGLVRQGVYRPGPGWARFALRLIVASAAMAAALVAALTYLGDWYQMTSTARGLWMALICSGGALLYGAVLLAAGLRLRDLRSGP